MTASNPSLRVTSDADNSGPERSLNVERNVLLVLSVYNADIHRGLARFGRDHGWHIPADLEDAIPHDWKGDGVLTKLDAPEQLWRRLRRLHVPMVDLAESRPEVLLPRVTIDNAAVVTRQRNPRSGERSYASYLFIAA